MKLYTRSFTQRACQWQARRARRASRSRSATAGRNSRHCPFSPRALRHKLIATQLLDIDLTRSQQTRKHFLITTNSGPSAPCARLTHHSSLLTQHCLTPFLFNTNKTHRIITLMRTPLKTKEKQFSIQYKFAVGSIGNLACALRSSHSVFLAGRILGTVCRKSAKQKINRQPAGDQDQPRPSRRSPIPQQHHKNYARPNNVKRRHHRITERLIRPFRQRPRAPQTKNPNNRQNIKNQNSRNNVIQQIAIKVPIFPAARIISPRQNQKRSPNSLHQQRNSRHSSP